MIHDFSTAGSKKISFNSNIVAFDDSGLYELYKMNPEAEALTIRKLAKNASNTYILNEQNCFSPI